MSGEKKTNRGEKGPKVLKPFPCAVPEEYAG